MAGNIYDDIDFDSESDIKAANNSYYQKFSDLVKIISKISVSLMDTIFSIIRIFRPLLEFISFRKHIMKFHYFLICLCLSSFLFFLASRMFFVGI